MQNPDVFISESHLLETFFWLLFFFSGSDKLERNTFWNMKTIWNLIIFSIHNEIPVQSVSVHVLIIFRMHYPSVIHCLAIILLVFFPLAFPLCPWLSNNPFFMDAKNKNGGISDISYCECHITLDRQITYSQLSPLRMKSGVISENAMGWLIMCVTACFHNTRAHFCSDPFSCAPCVSEGVSLEEQVRRIKDIEAIESDSFVPQAFKSSRDDTKVRSVSLSLSCYLFSPSLIGFTSPRCYAVCPETAQTKSNIHSAPFVPTWDGFIRRSAVQRLQSGSTHTKATPRQQPSSVSLPLSLSPPSGCADADKTQKSLLERLQRSKNSICWGSGLFWKESRQHVTAVLHGWFGSHPGESDKGQDPHDCSLDCTETQREGTDCTYKVYSTLLHI